MVKKKNSVCKKTLSLFLSALMTFSCLGLIASPVASAAVTLLNADRSGLCASGNVSRYSGDTMNIVNDGEKNNTDAGILHFNIADLDADTVSNVKLHVKANERSDNTNLALAVNFWYTTSSDPSAYCNNREHQNLDWGAGDGAISTFLGNLGVNQSTGWLGSNPQSSTRYKEIDITSKFQAAIRTGSSDFYVILMMNQQDGTGNGGGGWSDAKYRAQDQYITYDIETDYVSAYSLGLTPYSGNHAAPESFTGVAYYGDNGSNVNVATGGYGNVIYCSRTTNVPSEECDRFYTYSKVFSPNCTILAYDGVHEASLPLVLEIWPSTDWRAGNQEIYHVYPGQVTNMKLQEKWHGIKHQGKWYEWPNGMTNMTGEINYVESDSDKLTNFNKNTYSTDCHCFFWNKLYYTGSGDTNAYYEKIDNMKDYHIHGKSSSNLGGGEQYANITFNKTTQTYLILNYKPIYSILNNTATVRNTATGIDYNFRDLYNAVYGNERHYTPATLNTYYRAVAALVNLNVNAMFDGVNDSNAEQKTIDAAAQIKAVYENYVAAVANLSAPVHNFSGDYVAVTATTHARKCVYGACDEKGIGSTVNATENCSFTITSEIAGNDSVHLLSCGQNCGNSRTSSHNYDAGEIDPASTCTVPGTKTYTCRNCRHKKTETVALAPHDFANGSYVSADDGKHAKQCANCDAVDTANAVACSGGSATCIAKAKCEVCGAEYGDYSAHTYGGATYAWADDGKSCTATRACTVEGCTAETQDVATVANDKITSTVKKAATCTAKGITTYTATFAEGFGSATKDVADIDALGHTPAAAVRENEVAATCTKEGSYDEVVYCSVCSTEISRTPKTIEKIAHTPGTAVKENNIGASCLAEGSYDEVVYCSVCKTELSRINKTTDKLAHTPGTAVRENEVAASCTAEGSYDEVVKCSVCHTELARETKTIEKLAHDFTTGSSYVSVDGDKHAKKCANCDALDRENAVACSGGSATCIAKAKCEVCGAEYGDYSAHTYGGATYAWADDGKSCTATRACTVEGCNDETQDVATVANDKITSTVKKAATCTAKGITTYTATFAEGFGSATKDVADIDALGHTPAAAVRENENPATCTKEGSYDEVVYCSVCNAEISRENKTIEMIDHVWTNTKTNVKSAATCTEDAVYYKECSACNVVSEETWTDAGSKTGHNFTGAYINYNDGTHSQKCVNSDCNAESEPVACSTWTYTQSNDDVHTKKCTECNYLTSEAHNWDAGVVTVSPTLTTEGEMTYTCTKCAKTRTETIDELTHEHTAGIAATCVSKAVCSECGEQFGEFDANNHDFVAGTEYVYAAGTHAKICAREGCSVTDTAIACTWNYSSDGAASHTKTCAVCGNSEQENHTLNTAKKDAEKHTVSCEYCSYSEDFDHAWVDGDVIAAATCSTPGSQKIICSACAEESEKELAINPDNHEDVVSFEGKASTCVEHGYTAGTKCNACGNILTGHDELPFGDHDFDSEPVQTVAATCKTVGYNVYACKYCPEINTVFGDTLDPDNHASTETYLKEGTASASTCKIHGKEADVYYACCDTLKEVGAELPLLAHVEGEGVVTLEPTENEFGEKTYYCVNCGDVLRTEIIDRLLHVHTGGVATCKERAICDLCGKPYGDYDNSNHGRLEPYGYERPSCTEPGHSVGTKCAECGAVVDPGSEIPPVGHMDNDANGKCDVCGEPLMDNITTDGFRCTLCDKYDEMRARKNPLVLIYFFIHTITHFVQWITRLFH